MSWKEREKSSEEKRDRDVDPPRWSMSSPSSPPLSWCLVWMRSVRASERGRTAAGQEQGGWSEYHLNLTQPSGYSECCIFIVSVVTHLVYTV